MNLVILAAGMGSRFGGLKQIEPIDKDGNFIIDYSIYDAKQAGFDKVVFIIKEENYEIFKSTIGSRVEGIIETHYCFQSLDLLPEGYSVPEDRVKPLGTAQAILAAKPYVSDSFIIINADDYYGADAFKVAANYLRELKKNSKNCYANVAYQVANTMTENGSVKRGVLVFDEHKKLESLIESKIEKKDGKIIASPLDGAKPFEISKDTLVSMNMFCFTLDIFNHIEDNFALFMEANKDNLASCEYLIPTLVSDLIEKGIVTCDVLSTTAVWYGITYKDDKQYVVDSLAQKVLNGEYPDGVWTDSVKNIVLDDFTENFYTELEFGVYKLIVIDEKDNRYLIEIVNEDFISENSDNITFVSNDVLSYIQAGLEKSDKKLM